MSTPSLELPTAAGAARASRQQSRLEPAERDRLIRRAKALSWLSLAYMTAEGAIAITAAILASSVALLGFGLDSVIEGLASIIVIWRFTGTRRLSEHAEQRAAAARRDHILPARPLHHPGRHPHTRRRRASRHQLARYRPVDLEHHRHATARQSQARDRPAPWLRRDRRRGHAEHALRLPRAGVSSPA